MDLSRFKSSLMILGERGVFVCIHPGKIQGVPYAVYFWEEGMPGFVICHCYSEEDVVTTLESYMVSTGWGVSGSA